MMKEFHVTINGSVQKIKATPSMPLLWALRDIVGLTGTKYGCGIGLCGACTVLVDEIAVRSCSVTIQSCASKEIETIEGVVYSSFRSLQEAWIEEQVPQCGYCQSGQIMSAIGLLNKISNPTDEEILDAMSGNICRCGTYPRILKAIKSVVAQKSKKNSNDNY